MSYQDRVLVKELSWFTAGTWVDYVASLEKLKQSPHELLRVWANDNDIQYLKIVSTNIGFIREYSKYHIPEEKPALGPIPTFDEHVSDAV